MTAAARPLRVLELDGLRGIAIAMVLVFHCARFSTVLPSFGGILQRLTWSGWAGVDVFFVLSGFLVGGILLKTRDTPGTLRSFFIRRGTRILPLYFLVLVSAVVIPVASGIGFNRWPFAEALPWWSYATLTQNFLRPVLHTDSGYLVHTWSLAVELQVYVLAGLLLVCAPRRMIVPALLGGIVLSVATRIIACALGNGEFGYFVLFARLDAACLGILAAMAVRNPAAVDLIGRRRVALWFAAASLVAVAVALIGAGQGISSWGSAVFNHLAFATASAVLILLLTENPDGWANRALRFRPLVALGGISYGVYLLHIPVVSLTNLALGNSSLMVDRAAGPWGSILGLAITIALAAMSWRFIESPLIDAAHRWTRRPTGATPLVAPVKPVTPPA